MTDQINIIDMDRRRQALYVMYSLPQDVQVAVQNFIQRYGYQPKETFNWFDKYLLVGPVEDQDE